jgi:hypothetical protein
MKILRSVTQCINWTRSEMSCMCRGTHSGSFYNIKIFEPENMCKLI